MTKTAKITEFYVDIMLKLGRTKFALLVILVISIIPFILTFFFTFLFGIDGKLHILRSLAISIIVGLAIVYFFYSIIEQIQHSRKKLAIAVEQLNELHQRDIELTSQLKENITQLNQEIAIRKKTEAQYQDVLNTLQIEIIERQKVQTELEKQSNFLRSFIDASPDPIFYRNEEGRFLGCNHALEVLCGKTEKELIGLSPADVYSADVARDIMESDQKVLRYNIRLTYEQWSVDPAGRKVCFEIKKIPFYDNNGKRQGFMGFARDVTERKSYQSVLEKTSQEKTTFISTISHELRTPLNGIIGLSRILLETHLTDEQRNYLKTIYVSATTLGIIFNDIVEFDKIERRRIQIEQAPFNLSEFFSDLTNLAKIMAEQKKLHFSLTLDSSCPAYCLGDHVRLNQILWNIVHNSVKFTHQGYINVYVWYTPNDEMLHIRIEDTGIGIEKSEFSNIFTMYYQTANKSGFPGPSGTGIGLAVSKRLAKAMGGNIEVISEVDKGSCFTVEIHAPIVADMENINNSVLLPSLHILLVEDVELNVIVASSVLEKLGHTIEIARTGQQALDLFTPDAYDMVLLDIQLPDMTGIDIAKQLRAKYQGQTLPPLVAFTANTLKPKQEYLDAGIDEVITKPLAVPALNAIIARLWGIHDVAPLLPRAYEVLGHNEILDVDMLTQYIHLIGIDLMNRNIDVFEQVMPEYLAKLDTNLAQGDETAIAEEGHKIKGAAGSLGLRHLQQLAQRIQTPSLPGWKDQLTNWVEQMKQQWYSDLNTLRNWINSYEQKK